MLFDGITLAEGSDLQNLAIDTGATFPLSPDTGELFYRNDVGNEGMYMFDGTSWLRFISEQDNGTNILPAVAPAGTYRSVTISEKGLVTAGTNPTTLAGYGITDAQPLDGDLTAISALSGSPGLLRKTGINSWSLDPSNFLIGNQPITVSGDASGSGSTSIVLTLSNTGVTAASYGGSSIIPSINVDAKGRVISVSNNNVAVDATAIVSGQLADARISQSSITQHQSALAISESQITDGLLLARNAGNEIITGNWTFNSAVTGQNPTVASHLATKAYVDNVAQGLTAKASVEVATTANISLLGLPTIDGVAVVAGARVLVKNQTNATENGVYVASTGSWVRAEDMDGTPTNDVAPGNTVFVEQGTASGNTTWVITNTTPISLGTTPITWSLLSRIGGLSVSGGLTLSGNDIAVASVSPSRIVVNANNIDLATTGVTAGTYTSVSVDSYGRVTAGTNPTTLAGYGPSTSPSASTLVARDSNGYAFFYYINSNTSNSENPTISQVIVTNGGDGYYRKASIAHLTASLSGTAPINISGTAAGATLATKASTLSQSGDNGTAMTFNWSGQGGQPSWLWGSNDGVNMYVWNPSNFSVSYAASAGNSDNTNSISNAVGGAYLWTGGQQFRSNFNTAGGSSAPLQAYSDNNSGAVMSFHRAGQYAVNMGLDSDNVFRIGGWSASANRLQMDMSGNLTMAGDVTAFSDIRKKKNISTITAALDKVNAMRGVMFTRIEDDVYSTGVIAQEMQQVMPEVVKEDSEGTLSVAYGNLAGVLIEAIKELTAKVADLEAKLAAKA